MWYERLPSATEAKEREEKNGFLEEIARPTEFTPTPCMWKNLNNIRAFRVLPFDLHQVERSEGQWFLFPSIFPP